MEGSKSNKWLKIVGIALVTVVMAFLYGHASAVLNAGAELDFNIPQLAWEHIKAAPFDVFHNNMFAAYFIVLVYILILVTTIAKTPKPRAEMKGEEHGSNDFQTIDERAAFIKKNASPVMPLDTDQVQRYLDEWHKNNKKGADVS